MTPEQAELVEQHVDVAQSISNYIARKVAPWADLDDFLGPALESLTCLAMRYDPAIGSFKGYVCKELPRDIYDEIRRVMGRGKGRPVFVSFDALDGFEPEPLLQHNHLDTIERIETEQRRDWIATQLWRLRTNERRVVLGLLDGKAQKQIAADLGLHESRIAQLRAAAIEKLRAALD